MHLTRQDLFVRPSGSYRHEKNALRVLVDA